jgi:hypothetical protein
MSKVIRVLVIAVMSVTVVVGAYAALSARGVIYFGKTITVLNDERSSVTMSCANPLKVQPGATTSIRTGDGLDCTLTGKSIIDGGECVYIGSYGNRREVNVTTLEKNECP